MEPHHGHFLRDLCPEMVMVALKQYQSDSHCLAEASDPYSSIGEIESRRRLSQRRNELFLGDQLAAL